MKSLFISQPMKGLTDEEILHNREICYEYAKKILGEDLYLLDSFFDDTFKTSKVSIKKHEITAEVTDCIMSYKNKPLYYLSQSLAVLANADYIYFAPGWENSRGCKIEHQCATEYNIKIVKD